MKKFSNITPSGTLNPFGEFTPDDNQDSIKETPFKKPSNEIPEISKNQAKSIIREINEINPSDLEKAGIPSSSDVLLLQLEDTSEPEKKIQILEQILAHKRSALDKQIIELFNRYNEYSESMRTLFQLIHNKNNENE
jgi:hypothetical protein